MFDAEI